MVDGSLSDIVNSDESRKNGQPCRQDQVQKGWSKNTRAVTVFLRGDSKSSAGRVRYQWWESKRHCGGVNVVKFSEKEQHCATWSVKHAVRKQLALCVQLPAVAATVQHWPKGRPLMLLLFCPTCRPHGMDKVQQQ